MTLEAPAPKIARCCRMMTGMDQVVACIVGKYIVPI